MSAPDDQTPVVEGQAVDRMRRALLGASVSGAMGLGGFLLGRGKAQAGQITLRPPGALPKGAFEDACTRCFKCGNACPNDCIEFHGLRAGIKKAFTPYIRARAQACILCGECANACPTGALKPFEPTRDGWLAGVAMGKAHVNEAMCFSYHGRTCGACYRACPLAGQALKIGVFETPIINEVDCVGCGLCEQSCLHVPQAIRVRPV